MVIFNCLCSSLSYFIGQVQSFMFVGVIFSIMYKFFGHIHLVMLIRSNNLPTTESKSKFKHLSLFSIENRSKFYFSRDQCISFMSYKEKKLFELLWQKSHWVQQLWKHFLRTDLNKALMESCRNKPDTCLNIWLVKMARVVQPWWLGGRAVVW